MVQVRQVLDGNGAAALGAKLSRVQVISAYPVTPQSQIAEILSEYVKNGELNAEYIRIESEHSAMSSVVGASLTGVRAFTATASVGLALMHEVLMVASGCRAPIVMPVVNRSLVAPWNLWCDHSDTMCERDSGWIQLYAQSCQEALDLVIMAYRIAEDIRILLPAMVCIDGFFLSHISETVLVPEQEKVDSYLPPFKAHNLFLDIENPMVINNLTPPDRFSKIRYQQNEAFGRVPEVFNEAAAAFAEAFGRKYDLIESYKCEDAETVIIAMGSMTGTAKAAVDALREQGRKIGLLRILCFRPFPEQQLKEALKGVKAVAVVDRSVSLGTGKGQVATEIGALLNTMPAAPAMLSFVTGLGGMDVTTAHFNRVAEALTQIDSIDRTSAIWLDEEMEGAKKNG
ncbi:MAG: transketolase C-terminal domain-containing protein [Dethiobacteria bacterium]|jgi:pyruvate ferredoxin oxidoreductase alpha subunit